MSVPNNSEAKPEADLKNDEEEEEVKHEENESQSEMLYRLYDAEHGIPDKVRNKDPNHELNEVDKEWKNNTTMGDMEFRRIIVLDENGQPKEEELWFALGEWPDDYKRGKDDPPIPTRKVFVAPTVNRISDVNTADESFRAQINVFFTWMATEEECRSYHSTKISSERENKPELLEEWQPQWTPTFEFPNMIEEHSKEWPTLYRREGRFRIVEFKNFGHLKKDPNTGEVDHIPEGEFDCKKAKWIRAAIRCDMTFAEDFELESLPFDCQDLALIIQGRTSRYERFVFLPELRRPKFAEMDPAYSPIANTWDIVGMTLDFCTVGDVDPHVLGRSKHYPQFIISMKLQRKWSVVFFNQFPAIFLTAALSLLVYALTVEETADRLAIGVTLLLAAVVFDTQFPAKAYLTVADKYGLWVYVFLSVVMVENGIAYYGYEQGWEVDVDEATQHWVMALFAVSHIAFAVYAVYLRRWEKRKADMGYFEIQALLKRVHPPRPPIEVNYTNGRRTGLDKKCLTYYGEVKHVAGEQEQKPKKQIKNNGFRSPTNSYQNLTPQE